MKTLHALLFLMIPFVGLTQQTDIFTVYNDIYIVDYSSKFQQPIKITYDVPRIHPDIIVDVYGNIKEPFNDYIYQSDKRTSNNEDYKNNIYDKAHLAPKSHFYSKSEKFKIINDYANIVLMHKDMNNSVWKMLENEVKKLSEKYDINVKIEMIFSKQDTTKGGATIPSAFRYTYEYKDWNTIENREVKEDVTIYDYETNYSYDLKSNTYTAKLYKSDSTEISVTKAMILEPKTITKIYLIPNTKPKKKKISDYELFIGQLEYKEIKRK